MEIYNFIPWVVDNTEIEILTHSEKSFVAFLVFLTYKEKAKLRITVQNAELLVFVPLFCSDVEMYYSGIGILSLLYQVEVCKEKGDQISILLSTWAAKKLGFHFKIPILWQDIKNPAFQTCYNTYIGGIAQW